MPEVSGSITSDSSSKYQGASAVITHKVRKDKHADYEKCLDEIAPLCRASAGHLDWHVVRPINGLSVTFTIITRFDNEANLQIWMNSKERNRLVQEVRPLLATDDDIYISSGLDFWFSSDKQSAKNPARWKQYIVTWSVIYPLVLITPLFLLPFLRKLGLPENYYVDMLFTTGLVVGLIIYLVMPNYIRPIKNWFYK